MTASAPSGNSADTTPLWRRIWFMPLGQIFRGEAHHHLNYRQLIDSAHLPAPAADLTLDCVKRTRLWRSEKTAVAAELISHFRDGLEAGMSAEELARSFGEVSRAARLIRRAKKRNRPFAWHGLRYCLNGFLILILLYVILGVYFMVGRPTPSVDYRPQINEVALAVPDDERAWPIYREALLQLEAQPRWERYSRVPRPGEAGWQDVEAYLQRQTGALAIARQASAKPGLGFVVGYDLPPEDQALWPDEDEALWSVPGDQTALLNLRLMHVGELRQLAKVMAMDADRAAAMGDGHTVQADITALRAMARHVRETPLIISDLVGLSILSLACKATGDALALHPDAFSDAQLMEIAHLLGDCREEFEIRFDGERLAFEDVVQRIYTDNGNGDGRLTFSGLHQLASLGSGWGPVEVEFDEQLLGVLAGPAIGMVSASREELLREYDHLMSVAEAEARLPLWRKGESAVDKQLIEWKTGTVSRFRYLLLTIMMPALSKTHINSEYAIMKRDAVLTALALELHHRQYGGWPDELEELTPHFLPSVPLDRFDGEPLRYALIDGEPVLYCIGYDRDDDGGKPPIAPATAQPYHDEAQRWVPLEQLKRHQPVHNTQDGDWILWPRPIKPLIDYGLEDDDENEDR